MRKKSKESVLFLSGVLILSLYVFDVLATDNCGINVALRKPVTASQSESAGNIPSHAVDGSQGSPWNSGGYAPQWIEIDLESEIQLTCASLRVDQRPAGNTVHVITGRNLAAEEITLAILEGYTTDHDSIHIEFQDLMAVRWVRITTIQSPSWVAWYEIELYAPSSVPIRHHTWSNIKSYYESGAD